MSIKTHLEVYIRVRPSLKQENQYCHKFNKQHIILHVNDNQLNIEDPDSVKLKNTAYKCKQFEFGNILNENTTNEMIYRDIIRSNLIQTIQDNLQLKIITYGQAGSGKSFTLFGNNKNGLVHHIINELLNQEFSLKILEITKDKTLNLMTVDHENFNAKIQIFDSVVEKIGVSNKLRNNIHIMVIFTFQSGAQITLVEIAVNETKINYTNIIRKYSLQSTLEKKNCLKPMSNCIEALANEQCQEEMLTTILKNFNDKTLILACVLPTSKAYQGTLETLTLAQKICYMQKSRNSVTQDLKIPRKRTKSDVQTSTTPQKLTQKYHSFINSSQLLKSKVLSTKESNTKKHCQKIQVGKLTEKNFYLQQNFDEIRYSTPVASTRIKNIYTKSTEKNLTEIKDTQKSTAPDISCITEMSEFLNQSSVMDILIDLEKKEKPIKQLQKEKSPIIIKDNSRLSNFRRSLNELYKLIFEKPRVQDSNRQLFQISKINILLYEYKLYKWQLKTSEERMIGDITTFATNFLYPKTKTEPL